MIPKISSRIAAEMMLVPTLVSSLLTSFNVATDTLTDVAVRIVP